MFFDVLFIGYREVGPGKENGRGGLGGASLHLGFYGPGDWGLVVFFEKCIGYEGIFIFGIEEKSVHVEETGANWGETLDGLVEGGRELKSILRYGHTLFGVP